VGWLWIVTGVFGWGLFLVGGAMVFVSGMACADAGPACTDVMGWGIVLLPVSGPVGGVLGGLGWLLWWLCRDRPWGRGWHVALACSVMGGMLAVALASRVMAGRAGPLFG
jgi:hypothetical protein